MKKAFVLFLSLVMVMTFSLSALATGFVGSPSGDSAPTLDGYKNENEDCTTTVDVLPFNDRDKLTDEEKKEMEDAFNSIVNGSDDLKDVLDEIALQGKVDAGDLDVSDLFFVLFGNCDAHAGHGHTSITLSDEALTNFAGLMVFADGAWGVVDASKYSVNGNKLTLHADGNATYAIVVNGEQSSPATSLLGEDGISAVWFVLMAVSAIGLVVVAALYRRTRLQAND